MTTTSRRRRKPIRFEERRTRARSSATRAGGGDRVVAKEGAERGQARVRCVCLYLLRVGYISIVGISICDERRAGANFYARRPPHMLDDSQLRRQVIADQQQLVFKALAEAETVQRKASRKRSFLFIALALLGIGAWRCLAPQKRLGATLFNQAAAMSAANAPLTAADATARLTRNTLGQVVGETNETDSDIEIMR